jgi:adenylate cyclase
MLSQRSTHNMSTTTPEDPWPLPELTRARCAIVVADVFESVRWMQVDEAGFIAHWRQFVQSVRSDILPATAGRLVKSLGDGLLLSHVEVKGALSAALAMHSAASRCGSIRLRVGIHVAEVTADDLDIYGSGVNLAARLAQVAQPGDTVVSATVRDEIVDGVEAELTDLGECWLKHIDQPVRAFIARPSTPSIAPTVVPSVVLATPSLDQRHTKAAGIVTTLAVLPVQALAHAQGAAAVLADMLTDAVIEIASRDPRLRVLAKASTAAIAGRADEPGRLLGNLGANYVLRGRIGTTAGRVDSQWQLEDARTHQPLRALDVSHAMPPDAGGEAVADVAQQVVEALCGAILDDQLRKARYLPLPNLPTHALLAGGVNLLHRFGQEDFERARQLLEALVERVPRHAAPRAWLARWHVFKVVQGWSADSARDRDRALELCRRALDIDDRSSLAHTIAGSVQASLMMAADEARLSYERALEINPSEPLARLLLGTAHAFLGEGARAVELASEAIGLSPLDPMRFFFDTHAAGAHLAASDWDGAIRFAQRSLRANRLHPSTYRSLAIALVFTGRGDEARRTVQELLAIEPGFTVQGFLARSAGARFAHGQRFAQALREAGAPA